MSLYQLLRKRPPPFTISIPIAKPSSSSQLFFPRLRHPPPRFQSTTPPPPPKPKSKSRTPPPSTNPKSQTQEARINKILSRLPQRLGKYTDRLRNAPVTHIIAFLILHEITAVVPLVGLAGLFHWTNWLPPYIGDTQYLSQGIEKFGTYFSRKGWFGFEKLEVEASGDEVAAATQTETGTEKDDGRLHHMSESGARILLEVATAYAVTKVLLPLRVMACVWATPWFARVFVGRVVGGGV